MDVVAWIFPDLASGLAASHLISTSRQRCPDGQSDLLVRDLCGAPLMTTIAELGSFLTREKAATGLPVLAAVASPPIQAAAANGDAANGDAANGDAECS